MLCGNARVSVFEPNGKIFIGDVSEGDLVSEFAGCSIAPGQAGTGRRDARTERRRVR